MSTPLICVQNDLLTLSPTMADLHLMKLSISFALSQSTKLSVLEVRPCLVSEQSAVSLLQRFPAGSGGYRAPGAAVALRHLPRPAQPRLRHPSAQERALSIAEVTRKLPIALAREGKVGCTAAVAAKSRQLGQPAAALCPVPRLLPSLLADVHPIPCTCMQVRISDKVGVLQPPGNTCIACRC